VGAEMFKWQKLKPQTNNQVNFYWVWRKIHFVTLRDILMILVGMNISAVFAFMVWMHHQGII
jgi:hypothetical protein